MSGPVSWERWQNELAFDRMNGQPRETAARNERKWYDNYVQTWNGSDENTRNLIDIQHGFSGGGDGGDGGGESTPRETIYADEYLSRIDEANDVTREDISASGNGLENTVYNKTYLKEVDTRSVTNNQAPVTPVDRVVNPETGQIFNSPAEARRMGVTNWSYADATRNDNI